MVGRRKGEGRRLQGTWRRKVMETEKRNKGGKGGGVGVKGKGQRGYS